MLGLDNWIGMICLLVLTFVIISVVPLLRLAFYYLGQRNPRFHKYLFRLNRMLLSKNNPKWNRFYFVMFLSVSLAGGYLLYQVLEKIMRKEGTMFQNWIQVFVLFMIISIALQELRPQKKSPSSK